MINYIVRERKDPSSPEVQGKYYGQPITKGVVGGIMLTRSVAHRTGHSPGAIRGILDDFFEAVVHFLEEGYNINIAGLGTFSLHTKSDGTDTKEEWHQGLLEKKYVHFRPQYSDIKYNLKFSQVYNQSPKNVEEDSPSV